MKINMDDIREDYRSALTLVGKGGQIVVDMVDDRTIILSDVAVDQLFRKQDVQMKWRTDIKCWVG